MCDPVTCWKDRTKTIQLILSVTICLPIIIFLCFYASKIIVIGILLFLCLHNYCDRHTSVCN